jgi:hypothetical protein
MASVLRVGLAVVETVMILTTFTALHSARSDYTMKGAIAKAISGE